jgi:hypothetical protein
MAKSVQKKPALAATPAPVAAPPKKRRGAMIGVALLGILMGGAGAGAYFLFLGPHAAARAAQAAAEAKKAEALLPPETMKIDRMVLPVVSAEGELRGYMTLEMVLELERHSSDYVKVRIPMIRHGFNEMMASSSVLNPASGGLDFALASIQLTKAANAAMGERKIIKVHIVTAVPI